jgi:acyl-homoserine-lactone acylase
MWRRRILISVGALGALLVVEPLVRLQLRPGPQPPTEQVLQRAQRVTILRDDRGIPHVFGESDADAAFGLAWAHAEDDFPMIQGVLAASRGQLGLHKPSWNALVNDGYAALVGVEAEVERTWGQLDPAVQEVFEGYAQGLNLWAWHHPEEADSRLLPFTGKDIGRGFVHKLPLMLGLPDTLRALTEASEGEPVLPGAGTGSNAHAIAPWRSADGVSRLNINSHQPWEGPVSWYQAHVHSEQGWDMAGGTFPGAPLVLHGTSPRLGWALTVNTPDRVDVYRLVTDEAHPGAYRFGDEWLPFEEHRAWLPLDTPWLTLWIPRTFRRTVHGPVVEGDTGLYAVRHVGMERGVQAAAQWFAMNKAQSLEAWKEAMGMVAIPMFNAVYADAAHIFYVYNARVPVRDPRFDPTAPMPGDEPAALWTEVLPFEALPQVADPASGFLQACNSTPFHVTLGPENPSPSMFPSNAGIETRMTNRSLRTLELLSSGEPIDREGFLALKWDRGLASDAPLRQLLLEPLRGWQPEDPDVREAARLLAAWDGQFEEHSAGAAIAALAWRPLDKMGWKPEPGFDPRERVAHAAAFLRDHHGRIDLPLGELQRLVHGSADLPLGGGPDVLNCTYNHLDGGRLVGDQGDSLVMVVEYAADGARAWSIHQYGSSSRPGSPHESDQAAPFVARQLLPLPLSREEIEAVAEASYHPGGDGRR